MAYLNSSFSLAEVIALATATATLIWLHDIYNDLAMRGKILPEQSSIMTFQDNKSALWMVQEPCKNKRSKHILTKLAFIKEHVLNEKMKLSYLNTKEMWADTLTKPLQGSNFVVSMDRLLTDVNPQNKKRVLGQNNMT